MTSDPRKSAPRATYRLQLRGGVDFARAAGLAPYLAATGISHLYLSPIMKAVPGSTHGYDAVDCNEIEPELGGVEAFVAMARAIKAAGLGIILDIVPNHMSSSPLNPWWRDVLEWGAASPFADHFDVDWRAPKLVIPRLGDHYGNVLKSGAFSLRLDRAAGEIGFVYGDVHLPLSPKTYARVLGAAGRDNFDALALRFATSGPAGVAEVKAALADALRDDAAWHALEAAAQRITDDHEALHALHEQQVWQIAHWRTAREGLTYRRFFEIAELVGVRVEQANVFEDVHRTVLELMRAGHVDGLRIDHIDGLADPEAYLERLRGAVGEDVYIVVEKILGHDERLRPSWPVAGTTGYEFIADLAGLLVEPRCRAPLEKAYASFIGEERDLKAAVLATKRRTFNRNLAGELDYLTALAADLARGDLATRDFGTDTLRRAIVEIASAMPVYRTYVGARGEAPEDRELIDKAVAAARLTREVEDETAFDFLARVLALDVGSPERRAAALVFVTRFQQTSGPLMAKALEDTFFYRYNRLIALNEVGGEPHEVGGTIAGFHAAMAERQERAPRALSATATHDTKRGEDARARLYALSEAPDAWAGAVARWSALNSPLREAAGGMPIPDPDVEWMFYQSLLGAWPADEDIADGALADLSERMVAFMRKAAREAKLHTTWTQPAAEYESRLESFVAGVLARGRSAEFINDFHAFAQPFLRAGAVNALTQLVVKLAAPGVPDIYQGTELWDLSLVDPDNRRPVDFVARASMSKAETSPAALISDWRTGAVKLRTLRCGLALRAELGDLSRATYVQLDVEGPLHHHVVAFARRLDEQTLIALGTRFALDLLEGDVPVVPSARWAGTRVHVALDHTRRATDHLTGRRLNIANGTIELGDALRDMPIALLTA